MERPNPQAITLGLDFQRAVTLRALYKAVMLVPILGFCTSVAAAAPSIQALTFKNADGRAAPAEIYIDGEITPTLPRQLATALASNGIDRGTIYFNSNGGDLQAGIELGQFIRATGFNTAIGKRGTSYGKPIRGYCQSACLMSFAGGVYRFASRDSTFGVHRFYARTAGTHDLALGQIMSAAITSYLIKMGVAPELFERMVSAGSSLQTLSLNEASRFNLINNGVLPPSWEIVGHGGRVYLQGEQHTWNGTGRFHVSCTRTSGISISAQYDADLNTGKILAETKHYSLRVDGRFVGIAANQMTQPTAIKNDFLTTEFTVPPGLAFELARANSIGFAWLPSETSIFYGFELPVSQDRDRIYSFIKHCTDN